MAAAGAGELFASARGHTFWQLAEAIDDAFARWDCAHLHQFDMADGSHVGRPGWDQDAQDLLDGHWVTLGRLVAGEQFVYEFDLGDSWTHLGIVPTRPLPYWNWGVIPDL